MEKQLSASQHRSDGRGAGNWNVALATEPGTHVAGMEIRAQVGAKKREVALAKLTGSIPVVGQSAGGLRG